MSKESYYQYVPVAGAELFTAVLLPSEGKYPTVVVRTPYVDGAQEKAEQELLACLRESHGTYLQGGYAVVYQHCRGRGKSTGDCIPYINEREDTLALYEWIRQQPFYNGELYPVGGSYLSSVHLVATPFPTDVKAAILEVQDRCRYNCNYRNGFYKIGLHGNWYVGMYKKKSKPCKPYAKESFHMLPLSEFSRTVFGEPAPDFDEILQHPDKRDAFWQTRYGGGEAQSALSGARIPILLTTGFYDIYTGGIFDMWNALDGETKRMSALVVHPYDHGGTEEKQPVAFEKGRIREQFGDYKRAFLDAVRGHGKMPFAQGNVTYYEMFGRGWRTDAFTPAAKSVTYPLGEGERTYTYNPYAPATFKGGLSANFGGTAWQDPPNGRYDILTFYTPAFEKDTLIKGKMSATLCVRSDCEDTCFYVRVSLCKTEGDYGLRDDITQISNTFPTYCPGDEVELSFSFDEHAFVVKTGERLRIDVSSSAFPLYVRHTNNRGPFAAQTTARVAHNTVLLDRSTMTLPVEAD